MRVAVLGVTAAALVGVVLWLKLAGSPPKQTPAPVATEPPPPLAPKDDRSDAERARDAAASNVLRTDYVGPKACEDCHAERFKQWSAHPHSRMNQNAGDKTVMGDFNDARIQLPQGEVTFAHAGDAYTMTLARAGKTVRRYRVTRTVGSRFMQFYIGKQIEGPEPAGTAIYTEEQKLPYGYMFRSKRWLPQNYFDAYGPERNPDGTLAYEPFDSPGVHAWIPSCLQCHNTVPYVYRLAFSRPRQGYPAHDIKVTSAFLDAVKIPPKTTSPLVIGVPTAVVPDRDLVTLGVSCEACHFGGRAHVAAAGESTTWLPTSDLMTIKPPDAHPHDGTSAYVINGICTQCHDAQAQTYPNGAGVANSREALDMLAGACNPAIKCTDCHDPHVATGAAGQPASEKQLGACVTCHDKYRKPAAAAAHSKHQPGVTCLDCHMPRISQGLDQIVRSHRISSPADPIMLSTEQPNACNLCHLDKSIAWTASHLKSDWGKTVPASSDVAAGRAWLAAESPFTRLAAAAAYGRSPLGAAASADLIRALEDTNAVNRLFAMFAVEGALHRHLSVEDYDPAATLERRKQQITSLLERTAK